MIEDIKQVFVGGVPYPVYAVDFTGGGTEPSKMTISFVNENGTYNFPILSANTPVQISIGSFFTFVGYAVSATKKKGVSGEFLEVIYIDTSSILDKYFVGLRGKHGTGFNTEVLGEWNKLILVGSQIDPCNGLSSVPDLCSPCTEVEESSAVLDCNKNIEYKILDVDYSFNELVEEVSKFIPITGIPSLLNYNYRAQYTGTVREVLNSWASDYGWSFYWDGNSVVFVDLSVGLQINDAFVATGCTLEERVENISIENNTANIAIAYFGQDGELKDYSCSDKGSEAARKIILKPLTLEDVLVKNGVIDPFISNNYRSSLKFEQCCAISLYSQLARDLYCLYYIYEITDVTKAEEVMDNREILSLLGNLEISHVCHPESADPVSKAVYSFYLTPGSENTPFSDSEIAEFVRRGAYFVIAKNFNATKEKFIDFETQLAKNCIGRYWYRYFDTVYSNGVDYSNPDGTLNYYKRGSAIQFDFLDSLPDSLGSLSSFLQEIQAGSGEARDNFFVLDRPQAWMPPPNGGDITTTFNEDIQTIGIKEVDKTGVPENLIDENYKIFIVFPKNSINLFEVGSTSYTSNPIDAANVNVPFNEYRATGVYGLRTSRTRKIPIEVARKKFDIIMPAQGGFTPSVNYGGYSILVKGKTELEDITVKIPKVEIVVIDKENESDNMCVSSSVNYKNITDYNLSNLTENCTIDKGRIYAYATSLLNGLKAVPNKPLRSITYSVAGLPSILFTMRDGLTNFSIRRDSSGTKTTMTFSEMPPKKPSEDMTRNQLEYYLKNPVYKKYIQNYLKQISSTQKITEI